MNPFKNLISKLSPTNVFTPSKDQDMARIIPTETGAILVNNGEVIGSYTRARDARRAATRRGLVIA